MWYKSVFFAPLNLRKLTYPLLAYQCVNVFYYITSRQNRFSKNKLLLFTNFLVSFTHLEKAKSKKVIHDTKNFQQLTIFVHFMKVIWMIIRSFVRWIKIFKTENDIIRDIFSLFLGKERQKKKKEKQKKKSIARRIVRAAVYSSLSLLFYPLLRDGSGEVISFKRFFFFFFFHPHED